MSVILGLHYGHHGTACIVKDGKLICAVSHEKLRQTRSGLHLGKFCHGVSDDLLDYVFDSISIDASDIDYIALSDWTDQFAFHPIKVRYEGKEEGHLWNRIYGNKCLDLEIDFRGRTIPGFHIGHQLSHAAAAFYTSPFDEAHCFTMDASGARNENNSLIAYGKYKELVALECPGLMVGLVYSFFTEWLGIGHQLFKAGALMALAGYGKVIQRVQDNLDSYVNECFFPDGKDYHPWLKALWKDLSDASPHFEHKDSDSEKAQNIAATLQYIFENAILKCINDIDSNGVKNLCLSGGSMLNCNANSLVLRQGQFENIHLFPGCGDDGCAIGASLYVAHHILGRKRRKYKDSEICYLGPNRRTVKPDYSYLAQALAQGKIIAWCNGRSEFGPRALGNRSILADPRDYKNRERINFEIKHREWYRPLAPVVLEEHAQEWFDFPVKSPFMLFTMPIRNPDLIPAVSHVDNSARIQTVSEKDNPHYYRLIKEFHSLTGVPVLINTSLNGNSESIVETDEQAFDLYAKVGVDILVLNGKIYE